MSEDEVGAEGASRVGREQHGDEHWGDPAFVGAVDDAATVRAEFAAFRAHVLAVALDEANRRGWCEDIYDVLRRIGFTEGELPATHAVVQVTRKFVIPLPVPGDKGSITADRVERIFTRYFSRNDLREGDYRVIGETRDPKSITDGTDG